MGMTIDDAISYYETKNVVLTEEEATANTIALNVMRKYQKIVQIMERTVDDGTSMYDTLQEIEEVIEDGNDYSGTN